jgi:hypothetical protein
MRDFRDNSLHQADIGAESMKNKQSDVFNVVIYAATILLLSLSF